MAAEKDNDTRTNAQRSGLESRIDGDRWPEQLETLFDELENATASAGLAVADHLRTVSLNGDEYATREAMRAESEELIEWAQHFLKRTEVQS